MSEDISELLVHQTDCSAGHPVILCTDDSGLFNTSLSKEYAIAAASFDLDEVALLTLAEAAVNFCFIPAEDKEVLRSKFEGYRLKHPDVGRQKLRPSPLSPKLDPLTQLPQNAF